MTPAIGGGVWRVLAARGEGVALDSLSTVAMLGG
ncbi:hypothetical protein EV283_2227 [Sphingomonas sp. BK036]|nr:hypothetical protein EV283_2227 [Sphingomonas sp. BK036]